MWNGIRYLGCVAVCVFLVGFHDAWAERLFGEKCIYSYSVKRLREIAKCLLHEEYYNCDYVFSSSTGNALFFKTDSQVAVVPLDPEEEVRVLPCYGLKTSDALRRLESRLLVPDHEPGGAGVSGEDQESGSGVGNKELAAPADVGADIDWDDAYYTFALQDQYCSGSIYKLFTAGDHLYAFTAAGKKHGPQTFMCEVYRRQEASYVKETEFLIQSPSSPHDGVMWIGDFDPIGLYLLLIDSYDLPFVFRTKRLVFDLKKREFVETKRFCLGKGFFLRGDVLARFDHPKKNGGGESDKDGAKGE